MPQPPERAAVVCAVKPWDRAKSRLRELEPDPRAELVRAMALDTLTAFAGAGCRLHLVGGEPGLAGMLAGHGLEATVHPDPGGGLNAALAAGQEAATRAGATVVVAAVSDLPCLRAQDVRAVLAGTGQKPGRWYLADAGGIGTTMLLARGLPLWPAFEGPSADRHAGSGARALAAPPTACLDVDEVADLRRALALGTGQATAAWAAQHGW